MLRGRRFGAFDELMEYDLEVPHEDELTRGKSRFLCQREET